MHPIVALAQEIKPPREPSFGYSGRVDSRTREIDEAEAEKRLQSHHVVQLIPPKPVEAVDDGREQARPEEGVHQKAHQPVCRPSELGPQSEYPAASSGAGQQGKVEIAYRVVVVKPEMGARNAGSPHDQDNAEVVELIAKPVHVGAVV